MTHPASQLMNAATLAIVARVEMVRGLRKAKQLLNVGIKPGPRDDIPQPVFITKAGMRRLTEQRQAKESNKPRKTEPSKLKWYLRGVLRGRRIGAVRGVEIGIREHEHLITTEQLDVYVEIFANKRHREDLIAVASNAPCESK